MFFRYSQLAESFSFCRLSLLFSGEGESATFSSFCFTLYFLSFNHLQGKVKGEGKNRKPAECVYAIARSTHERKSALQRRIAEQQKSRPHFTKSRQQISKTCPFFLQTLLFSGRVSLVVRRNGRRRHKRRAQSNRHSAIPHGSRPTSKEKPIIATKRRIKHLFIPNFGFTFAEAHQKNTLHLAISFLLRIHLSLPPPCAAHWVDCPSRALPSTSLSRYENTFVLPFECRMLYGLHPAHCRTRRSARHTPPLHIRHCKRVHHPHRQHLHSRQYVRRKRHSDSRSPHFSPATHRSQLPTPAPIGTRPRP